MVATWCLFLTVSISFSLKQARSPARISMQGEVKIWGERRVTKSTGKASDPKAPSDISLVTQFSFRAELPPRGAYIPCLQFCFQFIFKSLQSCIHSEFLWNFSGSLVSLVQPLSRVQLFGTPWTVACQASLSITKSQNLLKLLPVLLNLMVMSQPLPGFDFSVAFASWPLPPLWNTF